MKKVTLLVATCVGLFFSSCGEKSKNESASNSVKEFKSDKNDNYMLFTDSPTESVKWEELLVSYNEVNGSLSKNKSVINFNTENLFITRTIDSVYLFLNPIKEKSIGENAVSIFLIDERFKQNFNWDNKPKVDSTCFSYVPTFTSNKLLKIDITNLAKKQASKFNSNFPLFLQIDQEVKNSQIFSVFHSSRSKEASKQPKLKVYYH